jgi:hypothetical protein
MEITRTKKLSSILMFSFSGRLFLLCYRDRTTDKNHTRQEGAGLTLLFPLLFRRLPLGQRKKLHLFRGLLIRRLLLLFQQLASTTNRYHHPQLRN